jgi:hypothetical protein
VVNTPCRLRPLTFLPPSYSRGQPTIVVLTDWLSIMAPRGVGITPHLHAGGSMQCSVEPLPEALHTPQTKVMVDRFPRRQIMRQQPPGAATAQDIEDGIEDVPDRVVPRPASLLGGRQVWYERTPFSVRQIGWISFSLHSPYTVGTAKRDLQSCLCSLHTAATAVPSIQLRPGIGHVW